jgi:hypothetical protein
VKNRIWNSGLPSMVVAYIPGEIQLNRARYEMAPPTKKTRRDALT